MDAEVFRSFLSASRSTLRGNPLRTEHRGAVAIGQHLRRAALSAFGQRKRIRIARHEPPPQRVFELPSKEIVGLAMDFYSVLKYRQHPGGCVFIMTEMRDRLDRIRDEADKWTKGGN
jgi:hypothetical protein